eukprot:TRINITY_DN21552_c0_g1_i1.p1 TRINITY_DN21552_c0_g1~~TRINITY_DN21552_c0_g1_i1.p1  ORF type:complete len:204 (+),score=51.28 TRINITY_DN21552_c0_g1_i1:306-917(+)
MCDKCKSVLTATIVFGCFLFLFAIAGFAMRNRSGAAFLIGYVCMLLVLAVSVFGITIAVLVFDGQNYSMEGGWQSLLEDGDTASVCDIQKQFKCSGWSRCCGFPPDLVDGDSPYDESNAESPAAKEGCLWRKDECARECSKTNGNQAGCREEVLDQLHSRVAPFTVFMFLVLLAIFGGCGGLWKLQRQAQEKQSSRSNYVVAG